MPTVFLKQDEKPETRRKTGNKTKNWKHDEKTEKKTKNRKKQKQKYKRLIYAVSIIFKLTYDSSLMWICIISA